RILLRRDRWGAGRTGSAADHARDARHRNRRGSDRGGGESLHLGGGLRNPLVLAGARDIDPDRRRPAADRDPGRRGAAAAAARRTGAHGRDADLGRRRGCAVTARTKWIAILILSVIVLGATAGA